MGYQVNLAIQSYKEVVLMDRDEILERSRRENLGEDEYEREVSLRSAQLGMKAWEAEAGGFMSSRPAWSTK